jgi:transposase-like protein
LVDLAYLEGGPGAKRQTRFTSMDDKILSLYAKGMTTREIVATFKEVLSTNLIACVDGLKGFPDAINTAYPQGDQET